MLQKQREQTRAVSECLFQILPYSPCADIAPCSVRTFVLTHMPWDEIQDIGNKPLTTEHKARQTLPFGKVISRGSKLFSDTREFDIPRGGFTGVQIYLYFYTTLYIVGVHVITYIYMIVHFRFTVFPMFKNFARLIEKTTHFQQSALVKHTVHKFSYSHLVLFWTSAINPSWLSYAP